MAQIDIRDQIAFDRDTVYELFRDNLRSLLPHLPNIRDIEVSKHERLDDSVVEVINIWKAADEDIPAMISKFITPDKLQWTDYATWHDGDHKVDWNMETGFFSEAVSCSGTTYYRDVDNDGRTEVHITGELRVDASKIPGIPRLVSGKIGDAVEKFVVKMITPNMREVNRGAEAFLSSQ